MWSDKAWADVVGCLGRCEALCRQLRRNVDLGRDECNVELVTELAGYLAQHAAAAELAAAWDRPGDPAPRN